MRNTGKKFTLAELINGLDVQIKGDADCIITCVKPIQQATEGSLTFLMNSLYKKHLNDTKASAVIISPDDAAYCPTTAVISTDPYFTYAKMAEYFLSDEGIDIGVHTSTAVALTAQIHPSARIAPFVYIGKNVKIGERVSISPGCFIGDDCMIEADSRLDPNVVLYSDVKIGKRVVIASGTVIGGDGFGIAKHKGAWHKVPQLGGVTIEDDVEIGSNCSIDRGAIADTVICEGVKLDNLIQVGHNVRIGKHTAIAGCVGISGSTQIGEHCMVGGDTGFAGHISIADNVVITGGTAVTKSIAKPGIYSSGVGGLMDNLTWRKNSARVNRLEHLFSRVKELEDKLAELIKRDES